MRGRLTPVHPYNLNAGTRIVGPLHDLNTVDSRSGDIDGIGVDADQDSHPHDRLAQEDDSDSADCVSQPYGHSSHPAVEVEDGIHLESEDPPRSPYGMLTDADVLPIEAARSRFLDLLLTSFLTAHLISTGETPDPTYVCPNGKEKQKKRKTREVHYEGDPKYVLPLAYIANLYETLISEINMRLTTLDNVHEKTLGVALEAAGGLYRKLIKQYPKSGSTHTYKRREMASAVEARNRFPHLISGDEKRIRFVVVHGLELVECPSLSYEDAEWFKRLTGRQEAAISEKDYKFFSPRHKFRRGPQHPVSSVPSFPDFTGVSSTVPSPQSMRAFAQHQVHQAHPMDCHPDHQSHPSAHLQQTQQHLSLLSHGSHAHVPHLGEAMHVHHSASSQHTQQVMHLPTALHPSDRMMIMPAKFCDECGSRYLRESSKYCSECGTKRVLFSGA